MKSLVGTARRLQPPILGPFLTSLALIGVCGWRIFAAARPATQAGGAAAYSLSGRDAAAKDQARQRNYVRQQFAKDFRDLQHTSIGLLREHEKGRLTGTRLARDVKTINRCAKSLRHLMALGELPPLPDEEEIDSAREFDQSIRRLSRVVYSFAHNPLHQNSKVFDLKHAARAQSDLAAIISLSKSLENQARGYAAAAAAGN